MGATKLLHLRMEIKKSKNADLESGRTQRLLLGLVVALACVFVALEYTIEPSDPLDDPDLLAQLDNEMELPPMLQQENELMLAPKAEPKPETKIVVVEEESEEQEQLLDDEPVETDVDDDLNATEEEEMAELEPPPPPDDDAVSLRLVEDAPQFPGGPVEFMKWLTRNLKYPSSLEQQRLQGKVVAEFIVNKDGSITDVRITGPLHPLCDAEVLRVLRMMPRWTAGIENGEPCRTKVCIPVIFRI